MKKLVQLKREFNVKLPRGLKKRLDYVEKTFGNLNYQDILDRLGISQTHKLYKGGYMKITDIPKNSIFYLKKDLYIPKNSLMIKSSNCNFYYKKDIKNNLILKKGSLMVVRNHGTGIDSERLYFDKKSIINQVVCYNQGNVKDILDNGYFTLFLKKTTKKKHIFSDILEF